MIKRFFQRKIKSWRKKQFFGRAKSNSSTKSTPASVAADSFRKVGFYCNERPSPSHNKGFVLYDVQHLEDQTVELMLTGFRRTYTPMDIASKRNGKKIYWVDILWRGQLPLYEHDHSGFHVPKRLGQILNSESFQVTVDKDFQGVITGCASVTGENGRDLTWINTEIYRLMIELHKLGFAHSVEVWQNEKLVGGLYGVSLGAYFTIESQYSIVKNASKVGLVHLVARLRLGGYQMLDIDEVTSHLTQFGAYEISQEVFLPLQQLAAASHATWLGNDVSPETIRNEIRQLSRSNKPSIPIGLYC